MNSRPLVFLSALSALLTLFAAGASGQGVPRARVLVVSGANNHDWEWTSARLEELLSSAGRFDVEVTTTPATDLAVAERLAHVDAFVLDYNGPRWGAEAEAAFLEAVRTGTGVVVLHAANNAFPGWAEYEELVGLLWREGTSHGRFHAFDVAIDDRTHPLTATLPDLVGHPDELYHGLVDVRAARPHVLATALSSTASGGSGEREPMLLVRGFGQGRVVHTPLGHVWRDSEETHASWNDPQFESLVLRCVDWAATGRVQDGHVQPNRLTELERSAGWRLLFDGRTTEGWRAVGGENFPASGWEVVNGCLRHVRGAGGGDLLARETFANFELAFEWKVAAGANSGIKVRAEERAHAFGPEYQILDNARHTDGARPATRAAALYDLAPVQGGAPRRAGSFNTGRIVARDGRLEHWLNGTRVVDVALDTPEWAARLAASKVAGAENFGRGRGGIALQDHGDEVWFRSLVIRDLDALPGTRVDLVADGLEAWDELGDAVYTLEDDTILGRIGGGGQSFLVTRERYGDFLFEVDVKNELPGNSGIQIRSNVDAGGRLRGYQIEIDASERAWSGGLYDEARRGWLDDLTDNEAGRAAFRSGEWNRYRIECVGTWIRAWVNGIPTADAFDPLDLAGVIGLQVHSGNNTRVRWRRPVLYDLGQRAWQPWEAPLAPELDAATEVVRAEPAGFVVTGADELVAPLARPSEDFSVRLDVTALGDAAELVFQAHGNERFAVPLPTGVRDANDETAANDLAIAVYGARAAVHWNGRLVGEVRASQAVAFGSLVLRVRGENATLWVENARLLTSP